QAQSHLQTGKYKKALDILEELRSRKGQPGDTLIFYLWARVKVGWSKNSAEKHLKEIEALFRTIPPEDRHNATYFFVRGIFKVSLGDFVKGKTYLKHTIKLNPNFLPAKRELVALRQSMGKGGEKTVLTDLSSAFTGIF